MLSCEPLDSPSMNMKGMEDDFKFAKVKVRKTFTKAGKTIDVDESMTLAFTEKGYHLSAVHNSCGNTHTSNYLFTQALEYYSKRQYKEALAMFEKQIELFRDPNAYYYAAIMYYRNQGCRGMGYSKRYQKFVEGMRVAANAGNYRAKFTLVREGIN